MKLADSSALIYCCLALLPVDVFGDDEYRGNGNCTTECAYYSGEFCGNDDRCHPYNCKSWYRYGPKLYTGGDENSKGKITCKYNGEFPYPPGVTYGCYFRGGWGWKEDYDPREAIGLFYRRHCFAINKAEKFDFECLDMIENEVVDGECSDCEDFANAVERNAILNCSNDYSAEPHFIYQIEVEAQTEAGHGWVISTGGINSTEEFNTTLALRTMTARLVDKGGDRAGDKSEATRSVTFYSLAFSMLFALTHPA